MAKRNDKEFNDNLNQIQTIFEQNIPGGIEAQALFIHKINKTIRKDEKGRVYFNQYALALRRKYIHQIQKSNTPKNITEIASMFNVSELTIRNDIREYYQEQQKKSKVIGLNFIKPKKLP